MRILKLTEDTRKDILQNILKRSPNNYGEFEGRVRLSMRLVSIWRPGGWVSSGPSPLNPCRTLGLFYFGRESLARSRCFLLCSGLAGDALLPEV